MSIAKKIIEGHKGKISVDSYPERGTEATIELSYKRAV
jgi:signal transduction histidine kinase